MEIRQISLFMNGVEDKWFITDEGDVYVKLKQYSRSYRMCIGIDEKGHKRYRGISNDIRKHKSDSYPCYLLDNKNIIMLDKETPLEIRYYKPNPDGYLYFSTKSKPIAVHRAVAICFGKATIDDNVHHLDENKLNNKVSNLEGMSNSEHRKLHTSDGSFGKGRKRDSKYLSFTLVEPNGMKYRYSSVKEAVRYHDINEVGLLNILSGYRKSYKGYTVEDVVTR